MARGESNGKVEETIKLKIEVAKSLLSQKININIVFTATGMTITEIKK